MADDDPATLAVVVARLDDLRGDFRHLRTDLAASAERQVGRGEWLIRNQAVDQRFEGQGREISEIKETLARHRLPWTTVATALVAIAGLALGVIQAV